MSSEEPSPQHCALLQLPQDAWQKIIAWLTSGDKQALTHTCKPVRNVTIAASALTQLSIAQHTMNPLPPILATLTAAFTDVQQLTLDLTGSLLNHTLPFLESFQLHCSSTLRAVTSLTLHLNSQPHQATLDQLAQLLGSWRNLATLTLHSPTDEVAITLQELSPGAGLHHLSHCFVDCSGDLMLWHLLTIDTFRHHIISFRYDRHMPVIRRPPVSPLQNLEYHDLPALQELSLTFPAARPDLFPVCTLSPFPTLGLTSLSLTLSHCNEGQLLQLLQQWIPSLTQLEALELCNQCITGDTTPPPSWSSLQHLTHLSLGCLQLTETSGVWHLPRLRSVRLSMCNLTSPGRLSSLSGLRELQMHGVHVCVADLALPSRVTNLDLDIRQHSHDYYAASPWLAASVSTLAGTLKALKLWCETLPESSLELLTRLTALQQLDLFYSTTYCHVHPQILANMTQLTSLSLHDNRDEHLFESAVNPPVPPAVDFLGMSHLQELRLDGLLSLATVMEIPTSVASLSCPVLANHDDGVVNLPEGLRDCTSLSHLSMTRCGILWFDSVILDPYRTLDCLTSLQSLQLEEVDYSIPAGISRLPLLTALQLASPSEQKSSLPLGWLRHSTCLKSLSLDQQASPRLPTLPHSLTSLKLISRGGEPIALPQHWGCRALRMLHVAAAHGISGVTALTALVSLRNLLLDGAMDATLNPLDGLGLLTFFGVAAKTGCQVTYWLPQIRALEREGMLLLHLHGCIEVPPSGEPSLSAHGHHLISHASCTRASHMGQ